MKAHRVSVTTKTHLLDDVRFKVLLSSDVNTDNAVLEPSRLELELAARDGRDHDVAHTDGLLKAQRRRRCHMARVVTERLARATLALRGCKGRPLRVLNDARDVRREDPGAIVRKKGGERATDDLGPVDDGYGLASGAVSGGEERVVDLRVLKRLYDCERGAGQDRFERAGRLDRGRRSGLVGCRRLARRLEGEGRDVTDARASLSEHKSV